ncbi:MAG: TolC family protein [Bacteroidales bacterium]|nr:TolC family protein [Bacteroidales bacterium]
MIKVNSAGCLFVWVLVLFLAGSLSSGGFSQDRAGSRESTVIPDKMTLRQCMEYAVEHSARVKVAQADLSDTRVERREAVLKTFTPQVSASSYGYYNWGRSVDPETNTYSNIKSFHNGYSLSAGLALFDGFQAVNNMKIAKTSLLMGISREQQAEDEVCLATMEAWSNVLYYSELSRILEDQVAAAQLSLDKARKEEQLGKKAYADVVQMEAELADKQYQSLQAKGKADDALLTLKSVMMWPLDTPLVLDSQEPSRLADNASKNQEDIAHIVDYALAHNPQAIIAEGNVSNARRQLSTARWQLAPSLSLSGGWSTTYFTYPGRAGYTPVPFREQLKNNRGEYIQLSINIPIYNRLQAQSSVIRRKNAYDRAVAERDQKMTELEAEVKRAVQDRDNTLSSWKLALKRAEVQQEAYKLNVKKYDQGMISSIEYQSAVNNWLQAQADRLQAQLTYMIKEKVLRYYQGQSYLSQR